jgi:hypothetical protein
MSQPSDSLAGVYDSAITAALADLYSRLWAGTRILQRTSGDRVAKAIHRSHREIRKDPPGATVRLPGLGKFYLQRYDRHPLPMRTFMALIYKGGPL